MKIELDKASVRQYYKLLKHESETEIRIINPIPESIFVNNEKDFIKTCEKYNGICNIYAGINERRTHGTKAEDVKTLQVFYFDIDPKRAKNTASTPEQKQQSEKLTFEIVEYLKDKLAMQHITIADSGNGYHILLPLESIHVNEPVFEMIKEKWKKFGDNIKEKFTGKYNCNVDSIFDISRISKIIGTTSMKGEPRPTKFIQYDPEINKGLKEYILTLETKTEPELNILESEEKTEPKDLEETMEKDEKIRKLFNGEWQDMGYKSRSEAELGLICKLMFYDFPESQIRTIMDQCKIGKWQGKDKSYKDITIQKAKRFGKTTEKKEIPQNIFELLTNPDLFNIIDKEFDKKIEGEENTRKAIFLSLCSIWVKNLELQQVNTLVNAESSAGKDYICKKIFDIFPENLKQYRTKITPEVFTYWHNSTIEPDWNWDGKICYLSDIRNSVLNSEAFKVMCSEGSISTTVIKGKAVDIEIKGKPAILVTTATANPKAEILNRFNLISLDETEEQTKRIMEKQGKRSEKGYSEEYDTIITESLSFLKRVNIKIPFGSKLSHFFPANILRMRRDFERFLNLIKSSVALHQKQRKQDEEGYYIAEKEDYELARNLIITIQTNSMIGLPHRLKKAYDCCNNLSTKKGLFIDNIEGFTAKEIHANFPFVSERMWRDYLDNLCEFKLLSAKLGEREGIKQKVTIYSSQSLIKINLPLFSDIFPDIQNISKVSIVSKVSKVTKVSKVKEKDITMETIETNEDGNTISKKNNELDKQLLKLKKTSFGVCGYCGEKQDLQYKDGEGHHLCQKCANDIRQQDKEGLL